VYLDKQPTVIDAGTFTTMPDRFRKAGAVSEWAAVHKPGENVDSFIEGPAFDSSGNLYLVDLAFGRIFRITPDGDWSIAVEYDGEPNGLKACPDGRFVAADYRRGLLTFDPESGRVESLLASLDESGLTLPRAGWRTPVRTAH
jgi:gluconolactonase